MALRELSIGIAIRQNPASVRLMLGPGEVSAENCSSLKTYGNVVRRGVKVVNGLRTDL